MSDSDQPYNRPVTDDLPTDASLLDLDVEIVGDGPDGPYLVLKDGTVITYKVRDPEQD